MSRLSPAVRLSLGLAALTCSLLMGLDLAGLVPVGDEDAVEARVRMCETLAAQAAASSQTGDLAALRSLLKSTVARNEDVISSGLRTHGGRLLVEAGNHRRRWAPASETGSTVTHVRVPLLRNGEPWTTLEVRFAAIGATGLLANLWARPLVRLTLALGGVGFFLYLLYVRRALHYLDPSSVIPGRVQAALDVMTEGVVLLDRDEQIVLANEAFASWVGRASAGLLGTKASTLGWSFPEPVEGPLVYPWLEAVERNETISGVPLLMQRERGDVRVLIANGSPLLDGWGRAKGAIATFSDVTELERRRTELEQALGMLQKSQDEIRLQNEELEILARSDPLTGIANRRAFLERFEAQFAAIKSSGRRLCCIMSDIDHFKRVNDAHGHLTGDEVIMRGAEAMQAEVRSVDGVARYGGEEFCLSLPDTPIEAALAVAERLRAKIASPGFARVPVTASFGVASIADGAEAPVDLINQADEALY
ncbi:MAG: diguanylate cyclase, partial [Myxococcales bacterium]|nr:diguanylate cyclase [Myxococcales bacterium]